MLVESVWVNADDGGKLGYAKWRCIPASPSQAAKLDPGDQHCRGQLGVKDHMCGDENPARR